MHEITIAYLMKLRFVMEQMSQGIGTLYITSERKKIEARKLLSFLF